MHARTGMHENNESTAIWRNNESTAIGRFFRHECTHAQLEPPVLGRCKEAGSVVPIASRGLQRRLVVFYPLLVRFIALGRIMNRMANDVRTT